MTNSGEVPVYKLVYAKSVKRDIRRINLAQLEIIKEEIEKLVDFPDVKNIKKLTHHPVSDFRLRVGNYRVLFDVDTKNRKINILKIGHRQDIY